MTALRNGWDSYGRSTRPHAGDLRGWADIREVAGAVGEAIAAKVYPAAARDPTGIVDFLLPDGTPIEAKATALQSPLRFADEQRAALAAPNARVITVIYDIRCARVLPAATTWGAVCASARFVVDAPAAWALDTGRHCGYALLSGARRGVGGDGASAGINIGVYLRRRKREIGSVTATWIVVRPSELDGQRITPSEMYGRSQAIGRGRRKDDAVEVPF